MGRSEIKLAPIFFALLFPGCRPNEVSPIARAWPVMGTILTIKTWNSTTSETVIENARKVVFDIDEKMSTYKKESEISKINQQSGNGIYKSVSPETLEVIKRALKIGKESGGRFDIAIGPLISLWKFFTPWQGEEVNLPPENEIKKARQNSRLEYIELNGEKIRLNKMGAMMDLGGIAKGYALDQAAAVLEREKATSALIDLGGQVRFVGKDPEGGDWHIAIRHPREENEFIATISVPNGSISTSGDSDRYFIHKGVRYSHIIDPTTGYPVQGTLSVTVWAPTGIDADAWSTALFVAGETEGKKLLFIHPEVGAVWVYDRSVTVAGALQGRVN